LIATYETALDPTAANEIHFFYVGPICIVGSVLVDLMELLVAGLQAYIYTFLTAMFLGLYGEPSH
jgi:F0F1-type ATP synthase membrane subunit a